MRIFILFLYAAYSTQPVITLQSKTGWEDLIASAVTSIIEQFYVLQSNNVFISSSKTDAAHNSILQKIFATFDRNLSTTFILHDKDYMNGFTDRVNNIVLIDSYESFRSLYKCLTTTTLWQFGYYTVVFTNIYDNLDKYKSELVNIFEDSWRSMILNINILTYSVNVTPPSLLLHTYFPFAQYHCGRIDPIIWNTFENDQFVHKNKQIFPQKTENLFQCSISLVAAPLRPYIFVTGNDSDSSYTFEGLEYNLLHELSKIINFKMNFSVHWDPNLGVVFDNGSANGILGMILERRTDLAVGALVDIPHVAKMLSSTKRYSYDDIILVVPNPTPYSSFETLTFPFDFTSWILIFATIALAIFIIKLLHCNGRKCYEFVVGSYATPEFNLLRVFLTGGTFYDPKRTFARFLLIVWILTCTVLQTIYQGRLFSFIKMNKMKPSVKSIDELIEREIAIKLIEDNYIQFLKFDQRLDKLLIFVDPNSEWEYVTETEAYITLETQLADEMQRKNSKHTGQFSPKPKTIKVITTAHVIYLPKRFYLTETIDAGITSLNENGLTSKWTSPYKTSAILDYDANIPRKLTLSQIVGMLEVWFGSLVLATIVFIFEVMRNAVANLGEITSQA